MEPANRPACPDDHEFLPLATGDDLALPQEARLETHLEACPACRERFERLRADIRELRGAAAERTADLPANSSATASSISDLGSGSGQGLPPLDTPASIGRYRIIAALDSGGQAQVFRVVHPFLEKELVVKWCRRKAAGNPELRDRLLSEGKILAELEHPNLARIVDLDLHEGRPFLVLEYLRGRNLGQAASDEPFTPRRAAVLLAKVAHGLEAAHRKGVNHLDVKPDNIVIDEDGEPRVIDFGLARLRNAWAAPPDEPGMISGTLEYMAPEQARGDAGKIGPRTDIFSLGGVLYFLLTGRHPFEGKDWRECLERVKRCDFDRSALQARGAPRGLARICLRAMEADPADRYPAAGEMASRLEAFARRRRLFPGGLALALLAVLGGLIFWAFRPSPAPSGPLQAQVWRGEELLRLADALPLRTGDDLRVVAELPGNLKASLFWLDTEGNLLEPSPVELSPADSRLTLAYPGRKAAVKLKGPPGTELIFVCARRGQAPSAKDLKEIFPAAKPWPELPEDAVLLFSERGVQLSGSRGPGGLTRRPETALAEAEALRRKLLERFPWFTGLGFHHGG